MEGTTEPDGASAASPIVAGDGAASMAGPHPARHNSFLGSSAAVAVGGNAAEMALLDVVVAGAPSDEASRVGDAHSAEAAAVQSGGTAAAGVQAKAPTA